VTRVAEAEVAIEGRRLYAVVFSMIPLTEFLESIRKYPNIPTTPAGSSMGADFPEFIPPNRAPQQK